MVGKRGVNTEVCGQESAKPVHQLIYHNATIVMLAYAVDQPASLDNVLEVWRNEIDEYIKEDKKAAGKIRNAVRILVGLKVLSYHTPSYNRFLTC